MVLIEWDKTSNFGIEIIDEEHEKLVDYINKLYTLSKDEAHRDELVSVFMSLMSYTITHFENEEALFKDTDYPIEQQEAHIREHEKMRVQLNHISQQIHAGDVSVLSNDLITFVVEWLVKHTQGVDALYVPYLKRKQL